MKDKKGKALVMELLDDILDQEDTSEKKSSPEANKPKPKPNDQGTRASPVDVLDLDISEVVKVDDKVPTEKMDPPPVSERTGTRGDSTLKINESKISSIGSQVGVTSTHALKGERTHSEVTDVKSAVGRPAPRRSAGFGSPTEAALAASENLRIAQGRILELEQEIERLRLDNEQLAAAGETLRRGADEASAQLANLQARMEQAQETAAQEAEILRAGMKQREKESVALRQKNEELEMRISTNIKKIRVRERELENRLELVKMESAALIRNKDEIILELKRQVDQLTIELDNYRNKGQDLNKQLGDKQDILRRTVKALRIALSMLEGEEEGAASATQKKVK